MSVSWEAIPIRLLSTDWRANLRQRYPQLKVAWYSGRTILSPAICRSRFDYIKIGPYIRHLGGLRQPTTNQRLYRIGTADELIDITSCFWNRNRLIG